MPDRRVSGVLTRGEHAREDDEQTERTMRLPCGVAAVQQIDEHERVERRHTERNATRANVDTIVPCVVEV